MAQARSMRSRRVALHRTTRAEDRGHGGLCAPCAKELPQASRERLVYSTRRGVLILRPRSCIEGDTMNADKLAQAIERTARHRAATDGIDPDQWRVVLYKWEAAALAEHDAQPAQADKTLIVNMDQAAAWRAVADA